MPHLFADILQIESIHLLGTHCLDADSGPKIDPDRSRAEGLRRGERLTGHRSCEAKSQVRAKGRRSATSREASARLRDSFND
jgi:hypothetical protein